MDLKKMIKKFQCPGCVCGMDTTCGAFKPGECGCEGHVLGTTFFPQNVKIALGLPKGFNRGGRCLNENRYHSKMMIWLWPKEKRPDYDWLNIPVWCHEADGFLFVRRVMPRHGDVSTDIIEGGKAADICPQAICVTDKLNEID